MTPRPARAIPAPYAVARDTAISGAIVTGLFFVTVVFYHRWLYFHSGVRVVDFLGSLAGVLLIATCMLSVAWLYRAGHSRTVMVVAGGATAVVAVGLAALPAVVAGVGWVSIVLSVLLALVLDVLLAAWAVAAALYGTWSPLAFGRPSGEDGTRTREGADPQPH
jgi:hypothetical protein